MKRKREQKGTMLVQVLVFASVASLVMAALTVGAAASITASRRSIYREQAIQIAEAGIDYYRWHLAHAKTDYEDGTAAPGPYVHEFTDATGERIGEFELTITPPPSGSTVVTVRSLGRVDADDAVSRTIEAQLAIPSMAKYAVVANDVMRFGEGTEVYGPIHSNQGIRFDGVAHNVVTSAQATYDDPDHDEFGSEKLEFGVHTHLKPPPLSGSYSSYVSAETPPSTPASRTDVFESGRLFPVPAVDFVGVTADLSQIKADAWSNGAYFTESGAEGYHIVLKTNDTFSLYKVTSLKGSPRKSCTKNSEPDNEKWGTWSINNETLIGTYAFPANNLIFVEDNLWVDGQINTARLTIVAAVFPDSTNTRPSITINNDLLYTNYDGSDVLALIAQDNINIGMMSADNFEIDAALMAQNGRVGRYYYSSDCYPYHIRSSVTLYGMIGSNKRYGFAYTNGTGYQTRNLNYDAHLLYGPPPSFPLTSDQYEIISWKEI